MSQKAGIKVGGVFEVSCFDKDGRFKWKDIAENLVVDAGLNALLDIMFHGSTQVSTWYVGLTDGTPTPAAGDTMSSHAGWAEVEAYDEAARVAYVEAAASGKSITNSASPAAFTISTDSTTVGGAFLTSVNTKGGTSGTLFCCAAFSQGDKACDDGDTVNVTYTLSAADDEIGRAHV